MSSRIDTPKLRAAFENFNHVLQDLLLTFHEHSEEEGERLITSKFYKIREWNPERYHYLGRCYEHHVDLVEDLTLELTRAANYVCDCVREFVDPLFRLKEGVLVCESGMYMDLTWHRHRVEYRGQERKHKPYPGLEDFKEVRESRDDHFGKGLGPDRKRSGTL